MGLGGCRKVVEEVVRGWGGCGGGWGRWLLGWGGCRRWYAEVVMGLGGCRRWWRRWLCGWEGVEGGGGGGCYVVGRVEKVGGVGRVEKVVEEVVDGFGRV